MNWDGTVICEKTVKNGIALLKCDNLSGMIPDRLSHYFGKVQKKFLTFPPVEAVNFGSIFRRA